MQQETVLFDHARKEAAGSWTVVNDGVMGGRSSSAMVFDDTGVAEFCGHVSLENNGGFASVRLQCDLLDISGLNTLRLRVKGTPGRYQLRCRALQSDRHSYVAYFEADGTWQEVAVELTSMYPVFRGRRLELPVFPAEVLSEVGILVGNKKEEDFCLRIERIWLDK